MEKSTHNICNETFFKCELMKDRYIWLVASQKVTVLNSSSDSFGRRRRWWFFSALWPMGKNSKSLPTKIFAQLLNEHRQMNGQNESCLSLSNEPTFAHEPHKSKPISFIEFPLNLWHFVGQASQRNLSIGIDVHVFSVATSFSNSVGDNRKA